MLAFKMRRMSYVFLFVTYACVFAMALILASIFFGVSLRPSLYSPFAKECLVKQTRSLGNNSRFECRFSPLETGRRANYNDISPFQQKEIRFYVLSGCTARNKPIIHDALRLAGLQEVPPNMKWYDLLHSCKRRGSREVFKLTSFQFANEFPHAGAELRDKAQFAFNVQQFWGATGSSFTLKTFTLPAEAESFRKAVKKNPRTFYMQKAYDSTGGKNIELVQGPDIKLTERCVAQEYLESPHLVHGKKYDVRVFVLVTSVDPLVVFVHDGSYIRMAPGTYKPPHLDCSLGSHITNTHFHFTEDSYSFPSSNEETCTTSVMTIQHLMEYIEWERGDGNGSKVWRLIKRSVTAAIVSGSSKLASPSCNGCFQLFGVDVMLDEHLEHAYVIEVNTVPSIDRDIPNTNGHEYTSMLRAALKMKGLSPLALPVRLREVKAILSNEQVGKQMLTCVGAMVQQYYYRERFDLAWPSEHSDFDSILRGFTENATTAYRLFWRVIRESHVRHLFVNTRPFFFDH
eukprot:gb/GECG01007961.1/.p1 GENE.gb/GECG01007961.1/~~gb/GECG01007961.1/.p1  ORF type:complete len:515 (+),score=36.34 gb/GECG01007961.1/:1-1545(+)